MTTVTAAAPVVVGADRAHPAPGKQINMMTIRERAAAALVRAREAGIAVPGVRPALPTAAACGAGPRPRHPARGSRLPHRGEQ